MTPSSNFARRSEERRINQSLEPLIARLAGSSGIATKDRFLAAVTASR
jgi:hypothetical protein